MPRNKVLTELLKRFPDAPALTLAKKAYRENPELWNNLEGCRAAVRYHLGVNGKRNRKRGEKRFHRAPRSPGDWIKAVPPALTHFDDWRAVQFDGPLRALVLSDIHIPYHDVEAVQLAIKYGQERKANFVLLNGDIADHFAISRWEKDPRRRDFPAEVRAVRQFLKALRGCFPKARIVFKEGNHDERLEAYLRVKAPDLLGLEEFSLKEIYEFDELKIQHVGEKRPVRLGKLNTIHGHEYRFAIANPVNPARGFFLRCKTHILGGHFHQVAEHSERTLEQKVLSAWSTGCLCGLHPDYSPLNPWSQGFAFVEIDKAGAFHVENRKILKGKVW